MCARRDSLDALGRQIDGLKKSLAAVMAEPEAPSIPALTTRTARALIVVSPSQVKAAR